MANWLKAIGIFVMLMIFTVSAALILGSVFSGQSGNIAVIEINGEITSDSNIFLTGGASSDSVTDQIADARSNPEVEAIIFDINSPGGSVVATKEIYDAVKNINKTKVCLFRETAASGAYWIATACDKIIANEFTVTGSIGVSGSYLEFSQLMEKYGIGYVRLVSGEKKDIGTAYREPTESEMKQLQGIMDEIYASFVADVAANRNMTLEKVRNLSDGSVFTGRKALELGLIDMIGGKEEAVNVSAELAGISEPKVFVYETAPSMWELVSELTAKEMVKYFSESKLTLKV